MKLKALLAVMIVGTTFTVAAADHATQSQAAQAQGSKQAPIQLSAAQMDAIVAGGYGPGGGSCGNVPPRDGTGNQYGRK